MTQEELDLLLPPIDTIIPPKLDLPACGEDAADVSFRFVVDKGGVCIEVWSGGRVVATLTREYAQAVGTFVSHYAGRCSPLSTYVSGRLDLAEHAAQRYVGPDANGDRPCVLTDGVPEADLARYAAAGAEVLKAE